MRAVWTNIGLDEVARYIARLQDAPFTQVLRLYANDLTPTKATLLADLVECSLADYAPKPLIDYTFAGGIGTVVEYSLPLLVWYFGAYAGPAITIYGAYSTNAVPSLCWWGKRQDPPYTVPLEGGAYAVQVVHRVGNLG